MKKSRWWWRRRKNKQTKIKNQVGKQTKYEECESFGAIGAMDTDTHTYTQRKKNKQQLAGGKFLTIQFKSCEEVKE